MRLLLDTHALLWWEEGEDSPLGSGARDAIEASDAVYVSAASAWEAEIKRGLGKLRYRGDVAAMINANDFVELPVTVSHATVMRSLPKHHRDPFDWMLVAQAMAEDCTLVTANRELARYGVKVMYAGR